MERVGIYCNKTQFIQNKTEEVICGKRGEKKCEAHHSQERRRIVPRQI